MTEDIPLEIHFERHGQSAHIHRRPYRGRRRRARVFFIKRNEKPPIARVFWCATLLIPLGVVAAWGYESIARK